MKYYMDVMPFELQGEFIEVVKEHDRQFEK